MQDPSGRLFGGRFRQAKPRTDKETGRVKS